MLCCTTELATLLQSCARLGHPHKASWLQAFVNTALEALQPAAASAAASASDSIAVPSPPDSLEAPAASAATEADVAAGASEGAAAAAGGSIESDKVQAFTVTVAQLLEAVARWVGEGRGVGCDLGCTVGTQPVVCSLLDATGLTSLEV